eukprot:gene4755-5005_t
MVTVTASGSSSQLLPHDPKDQQLVTIDQQSQDASLTSSIETSGPAVEAPVLPLPYAHYSLVTEEGVPLERPSKHPFALARVIHDSRELPQQQVWYQSADGSHRWRQTTSEVLIQLLALSEDIVSARQLTVELQPYEVKVTHRSTGEDLLLGHLCRGIIPEDSTWTLERDFARTAYTTGPAIPRSSSSSSSRTCVTAALRSITSDSTKRGGIIEPWHLQAVDGVVAYGGHVAQHKKYCLLLQLSKMNLELYERPHQPSVAWWPRLFQDDVAEIAWDDEAKDYSDLPPPVAAIMATAAAVEEEQRQREATWRESKQRLQVMWNCRK